MNKTANIFGNGRFARQLVFEKLGQGISRAILVSTFSELHALCSCLTTISIEYRPSLKFTRNFFVKFSASPNYIVNPKINFFGLAMFNEFKIYLSTILHTQNSPNLHKLCPQFSPLKSLLFE